MAHATAGTQPTARAATGRVRTPSGVLVLAGVAALAAAALIVRRRRPGTAGVPVVAAMPPPPDEPDTIDPDALEDEVQAYLRRYDEELRARAAGSATNSS